MKSNCLLYCLKMRKYYKRCYVRMNIRPYLHFFLDVPTSDGLFHVFFVPDKRLSHNYLLRILQTVLLYDGVGCFTYYHYAERFKNDFR